VNNRLYDNYDRWVGRLTRWTANAGGLLLLAVAFFVFYEVVCRYGFASPTVWVMDFSIYFIIWSVFLGVAYTMRKKGHVMVDVLTASLPADWRRKIEIVIHLLILMLAVVLTAASAKSCWMAYRMKELTFSALYIPLYYPLSAIPVGMALLVLEEIRAIWSFRSGPATRQPQASAWEADNR
jgi:TRAP-type C4-dicarboxylate transport system permease small subunit